MSDTAVQERETETKSETTPPPQPEAGESQQLQRVSAAASIGFGMSANNWEEGFRIANQLAKSALVPKAYQGQAQDIVVAMQLGAELGLPPMQALQSIAVINGRPGVYGDGFLAVIMASPAYQKHAEYFLVGGARRDFLTAEDLKLLDTSAVCMFWRKGNPDPFTATFSIADAQRAQLLGKQGPWTQYPARMMRFRARGFAGRDAFAGELRGMKTAEELQDTPIETTVSHVPAEPVRRSEKLQEPPAAESTTSAEEPPASATATTEFKPEIAPNTSAPPQKPAGNGRTAAAASGPGQVTKGVQITETAFINKPKNGGDPYYEIKGVVINEQGKPGMGLTWITSDEQVYRMAASCEGSDTVLDVTWHTVKQPSSATTSKDVKVITGLQAK